MTPARWRGAALVDVGSVALFVVIGRASHHHGETAAGIASTAWPFGVGLCAGWTLVASLARRRDAAVSPATLPGGAAICVTAVAVGMILRVVAGQGTAPAFIAVATGFLGAVMLGGRVALRAARRRPVRSVKG